MYFNAARAGIDPHWDTHDVFVLQIPGKTPRARERLVDALIAWLTPDRQLRRELNRFEVLVSDVGDTWIKRLRR